MASIPTRADVSGLIALTKPLLAQPDLHRDMVLSHSRMKLLSLQTSIAKDTAFSQGLTKVAVQRSFADA